MIKVEHMFLDLVDECENENEQIAFMRMQEANSFITCVDRINQPLK